MAKMKLKVDGNDVLTYSVPIGIDINNKIGSAVNAYQGHEYVATQDCWVIPNGSRATRYIGQKNNNNEWVDLQIAGGQNTKAPVFLKAGQRFYDPTDSLATVDVYGVLR